MSWPDWFGFPIFNSVDWEMRERQREMVADWRRGREGGKKSKEKWNKAVTEWMKDKMREKAEGDGKRQKQEKESEENVNWE